MLQTVDEAREMIEALFEFLTSIDHWERRLLQNTGIFVSHIERDGVVGGSGERAKSERPKRAESSVPVSYTHLRAHET